MNIRYVDCDDEVESYKEERGKILRRGSVARDGKTAQRDLDDLLDGLMILDPIGVFVSPLC
jgi:hypothetical protein